MSRPRQLFVWLACEQCGKEKAFYPSEIKQGGGRFCSRACKHASMQGQLFANPHHPTLPVGSKRLRLDGYIEVKVDGGRWILEHRLVAAEKEGRSLNADEHVHHISGVKWDNRPENLEVIPPGEHARLSNAQGVATRKAIRRELTAALAELERYKRRYGKLPPALEPVEVEYPLCEHCHQPYIPTKPAHVRASRYCSKDCRVAAMHAKVREFHAERRPEPVTCQQCGHEFQIPPYREGQAKYCSNACKDAALQKENPEKPCKRCGTMFRKRTTAETAKAEYCSRRCALAVVTENRLKDYVPPAPQMCAYCAQSYRPRMQAEAEGRRYCSRACWRGARAHPPVAQLRLISGGG